MNKKGKDIGQLDVFELLGVFFKAKWLILALAFLFATISFIKVNYFTDDYYVATGVLYVSNRDNYFTNNSNSNSDEQRKEDEVRMADIMTSRTLSSTYIEILRTSSFFDDVSDICKIPCTGSQIRGMTSIESVNETELLRVSVRSTDPEFAYEVGKAVLKQAPKKLTSIFKAGDVYTVDDVRKPTSPIGKGGSRSATKGFVVGAVLGALIAFLIYFFDTKVHSSSEISSKYKTYVLGEIFNNPMANKKKDTDSDGDSNQNILSKESIFDTVETYKSIRTNIMFSIPKSDKGKVIVITSSVPGEGKTTTSINMAITFAQTGAKVVLVDCDLRKARIHRYLQLKRKDGVSNILCGFCDLDSAIKKDVRPNLDVLTAGEIPPNPAELLEAEEFNSLIETLKERYEYIFIDTPPTTVVTDAMITMKKSQGVVVVAKQNQTTFDALDITMDNVEKAEAKLLGVIVLDSSEKQKRYGYYKTNKYGYRYKYGYKYGYRYGYKYGYNYSYGDKPAIEEPSDEKK